MTPRSRHGAPILSAAALLADIEAGRITPAAIVERCREAIAAHEATIGAFVCHDLEGARIEAARATGPLMGLPVGIKDIIDTGTFPTGHGSPIYAGNRPAADAPVVSLVRRAGGAIAGKTVTTEFAFFHAGKTRNPRNLAHTPGGSSSGSAAAVAAGMLPLAVGTQTGGSVVRPAAFCGIAGYKPTFGMLPSVGMKTFSWSLDTMGVFGAGVADAALFAAALCGRDLRVEGPPSDTPRIGLVRTHLWQEASGEMQRAVETAAEHAAKAGARVFDVDLARIFSDAFCAHQTIQDFEAARALAWELDLHAAELSPLLRQTLEAGAAITPDAYDRAQACASRARHALAALFTDIDVLLTPSAPGAAPEGLESTGSSIFNRLWTLMGTPALNVPGLLDQRGLPLGVQLVAPRGADRLLLEAGAWLEARLADAPTI